MEVAYGNEVFAMAGGSLAACLPRRRNRAGARYGFRVELRPNRTRTRGAAGLGGDRTVTVDGVQLKPALALGSYVVFEATHSGALAMGDLVLRESEIEPVISQLEAGGIDVTALHHHVLRQTPPIYYTHIHGMGDAVSLARAIRAAVALTSTPPPSPGAPPTLRS